MSRSNPHHQIHLPDLAAMLAAGLFIVAYVVLAWLRLHHPFELEWMEGGTIDQIRWILGGNPLYVPPSLKFVPYTYTPLYYYVSAGVAKILGLGFSAARLVSVLSSLGVLVWIGLIVRRQSRCWTGAVLAAGLFAATFRISGSWFDLARVDSLFLFLLLGGTYLIACHDSRRWLVTGGLLFLLAFLTKQTILFILPFFALGMLLERRWNALGAIGFTGILILASIWALDRAHGGWFTYYIFDLPQGHPILPSMHLQFWMGDLVRPLLPACPLAILGLVLAWRSEHRRPWFLLLLAVAFIGSAWLVRIRSGSYANVLMPAYAAVAILFGLGFERARTMLQHRSALVFLHLLVIMQFVLLAYDPRQQLPSSEDVTAGEELVEAIKSIDGEVYIPSHGHIGTLAGKDPLAHAAAIEDVLRGDAGEQRARLNEEILEAVRTQRFAAIILDGWWFAAMMEHYELSARVFEQDDLFWPVTGKRTRPELILTPRSFDSPPPDQ